MNNRRELSEIYNRLTVQQKKVFIKRLKELEEINSLSEDKKTGEARKFFKSLQNKVAPMVLSALMLASSTMLNGCYLDNYLQNCNQFSIFDSSGKIIENPATEIESDNSTNTAENIKGKYAQRLQGAFESWDINSVINQKYSTIVLDTINRIENGEDLAFLRGFNTENFQQDTSLLYIVLKDLLDDEAEFSINVNLKKEDKKARIKFYRKGTDTATFIITKNGRTYYNGIINNQVYAEGANFLPDNLPILFNEETAEIFNQLEKEDLGKLYGNELISFMFMGGLELQEKSLFLHSFDAKAKLTPLEKGSVSGYDHKEIEIEMPSHIHHIDERVDASGQVVQKEKDLCIASGVSVIANIKYQKANGEDYDEDEDYEEDENRVPKLRGFAIDAGEIYSLVGRGDKYKYAWREGYRVAEMQIDYSPQNIILPTTEAELSK